MKLGYCSDNIKVDDQVVKYQRTGKEKYFLQIYEYYSKFRHFWYKNVSEFVTEEDFRCEFELKLLQAVKRFDKDKAEMIAREKGYRMDHQFNRWLWRSLANMCSNLRSTRERSREKPKIVCPICSRRVTKIDEQHLQHYKTLRDLPRGYRSRPEKGQSAVCCPWTGRIVERIDNEYIKTKVPSPQNRYAKPYTFLEFTREFPHHLIHLEVYSLDYSVRDEMLLRDSICSRNKRQMTVDNLSSPGSDFEELFNIIDETVPDVLSRRILKIVASGYNFGKRKIVKDVSEKLNCDETEIRKRVKALRDNVELRDRLLKSCAIE